MAERLGRDLAARGVAVVSGLARGIDASAHRVVLSTERNHDWDPGLRNRHCLRGKSAARSHHKRILYGDVPRASEFPDSEHGHSRMSLGVVVVEGAQYFRFPNYGAAGHGVWPGSLRSPRKRDPVIYGPNQLIKEGAKLVTAWEDASHVDPGGARSGRTGKLQRADAASAGEPGAVGKGRFTSY